MDTLENAELTATIRHISRFFNQEYQFTILRSQTWQAEKQEEEEEHRQLQSVLCFTQTQKELLRWNKKYF